MHLSELKISGYKVFKNEFSIKLNSGLTVLIGENGCGKTTIIDAIRLLLNEDEFGRVGIRDAHFHRPIDKSIADGATSKSIEVKGIFSNLNSSEQVAYLPWLDATDNTTAYLNRKIDNKQNNRGRFDHKIWGGESLASIFEWELIDAISCIYLPPLRDAESKLEAFRGSRLSRLFKKNKPAKGDPKHPIEEKFERFNEDLLKEPVIIAANDSIKKYLKESLGTVLGQDALIQFSEVGFNRIVERLRLLFYPKISKTTRPDLFRDIAENSLGYNNILYLATVLAELDALESAKTKHKILLIEEPEAHLHPQLQIKLLQYLKEQSEIKGIQIIVTSHSPTIAASCGIAALNVITIDEEGLPTANLIANCNLDNESTFFLNRWLDITKSVLFFAKGILFVEGIAEALVIKELARKIIAKHAPKEEDAPKSLEDFGVSIINLNGIYFKHFMQLFQGYKLDESGNPIDGVTSIPIRCAGLTDCDPAKEDKPTSTQKSESKNHQIYLKEEFEKHSSTCRLFTNLKTFEYDLALTGANLLPMLGIYHDWLDTKKGNIKNVENWMRLNWKKEKEETKANVAIELLRYIEDTQNTKKQRMGKGLFAQKLAYQLATEPRMKFEVPQYIEDAILWVTKLNKAT